jgi:uncharacterized protein involved in response to NO
MKDDLICRLWQSTPAGPERDAMQMLETIRKKARAFQRTIFWRDAREIGAAALMVPICVYVAIHTRPSPLMSAGFFLTAASCLFIALWLWRSRRGAPRPAPEESVAAYGRALLAGYDRQIALLRTAKYWYVLPLYASMLTIYAGIIAVSAARLAQVREQSPDRWLIGVGFLAGVFLLMTALAGLVWWLNEGYAVRKLVAARQSLAAMLPADAAPEA